MSAEKAGKGSRLIRLRGSITLTALAPNLVKIGQIIEQQPSTHFRLDCSRVSEFTSQALAELIKLRREVQGLGGELVLTRCPRELIETLMDPIFDSLVEKEPAVKEPRQCSDFQGPHTPFQAKWKPSKAKDKKAPREPYFLRLRNARYQRFWLN